MTLNPRPERPPMAEWVVAKEGGSRMIRRRLTAVAVVALTIVAACSSDSSSSAPVRVGFVRAVADAGGNEVFDSELAAHGYRLGDNLVYVQDDPSGEVFIRPDEVHRAVEAWLADGLDLIVAFSSSGAAEAAKTAPHTPVLFLVNDPVAVGLVSDKARPDRNLTGVTFGVPADRTLDLASQAIPGLQRIGVLFPETDPAGAPSRDAMLKAASSLGIATAVEGFTDEQDISRAISALHDQDVDAVTVVNAPTSVRLMSVIEPAATALRIPIIANTSLASRAVLVLEPNVDALFKRLGRQAARLLSGTPPADVPVEDPAEFRVVLNRAVARELGLPDFSTDLVRQADQVLG